MQKLRTGGHHGRSGTVHLADLAAQVQVEPRKHGPWRLRMRLGEEIMVLQLALLSTPDREKCPVLQEG